MGVKVLGVRLVAALLAVAAVGASTPAVGLEVEARIDLSDQTMAVTVDGRPTYLWAVSTARRGYRTPLGEFHPIRLERVWYSTKYDNAPMPHSIFFYGGYAIHGTTEIGSLGRPVSHGCVRLHPNHANLLFDLVRAAGYDNTTITVRR
jgi:lipoprotein-anchoring transpeptidase ErfK/SrfK